ncbi:MAG: Uncharacterised protein [Alphaproteobacteria bacterium UBA4588]|nr:MAG: Uncharacterised protein [Alphaproteobacteria bacterium UBA4588]
MPINLAICEMLPSNRSSWARIYSISKDSLASRRGNDKFRCSKLVSTSLSSAVISRGSASTPSGSFSVLSDIIMMVSITFLSWRTDPGQPYERMAFNRSSPNFTGGRPNNPANSVTKYRASGVISSRRADNGGTETETTPSL